MWFESLHLRTAIDAAIIIKFPGLKTRIQAENGDVVTGSLTIARIDQLTGLFCRKRVIKPSVYSMGSMVPVFI